MKTETSRPAVIFYLEENRLLWQAVRDVLEFAGWYVRRFDSGMGYAYILSPEHYDILIIDGDAREFCDGLALVRRTRQLPHRRKTPIIFISLGDCADEARRAGADAFLRKPANLVDLIDTIRRLLDGRGAA